jgi:C4-dicarboxylate-specific signal transduction histidine kinase
VAVADDGAQAWEIIRDQSPDLVVSDVMMPRMSGIELCRAIKNDPSLRSTPVILLTAKVGSEATLEAYAHGADDFVAKPFHPRVLMARIRAQLNLRALALHLAQQEKLAVVGTMSAGILHEVRNPVNAILNASRAMVSKSLDDATRRQLLEVIGDAAVRIEEITSALDTHARPAEAGTTAFCDLREGLEATLKLIKHRLDGVTVHREFSTDRLAKASAGPMNQVLLNLLDNSLQMGAKNLWLSIDAEGDDLVVKVGDDGPGVAKEHVERIFDPFFTKRPKGDGTGLGLFLSRKMVEEAGGSLRVKDRSGGGALFIMVVPALPLQSEPGRAPDHE